MARLEDICSINMGQSPESSSYNENGEGMPFFQAMQTLVNFIRRLEFGAMLPQKLQSVVIF